MLLVGDDQDHFFRCYLPIIVISAYHIEAKYLFFLNKGVHSYAHLVNEIINFIAFFGIFINNAFGRKTKNMKNVSICFCENC